jgi:hypothetical protein
VLLANQKKVLAPIVVVLVVVRVFVVHHAMAPDPVYTNSVLGDLSGLLV